MAGELLIYSSHLHYGVDRCVDGKTFTRPGPSSSLFMLISKGFQVKKSVNFRKGQFKFFDNCNP